MKREITRQEFFDVLNGNPHIDCGSGFGKFYEDDIYDSIMAVKRNLTEPSGGFVPSEWKRGVDNPLVAFCNDARKYFAYVMYGSTMLEVAIPWDGNGKVLHEFYYVDVEV